MTLTACSNPPIVKYTYIKIPDALLKPQDCVGVDHGDGSVKELIEAYVENLGCLKKNEEQINIIRKYNDDISLGGVGAKH